MSARFKNLELARQLERAGIEATAEQANTLRRADDGYADPAGVSQ